MASRSPSAGIPCAQALRPSLCLGGFAETDKARSCLPKRSEGMTGRIRKAVRESGREEIRRLETECVAAILENQRLSSMGASMRLNLEMSRFSPDLCKEEFYLCVVKNVNLGSLVEAG